MYMFITDILALQAAFLFFVKKASMVGRFQRSWTYHAIQRLCQLALYAFPVAAVPMCLAFFSGKLTREGVCAEHGEIWFVVLVVCLAVPLCGLMTYLFVVPILENSSRVRHSGGGGQEIATKMFQVAKHNMIASGVAMTVTVLNGTSLCIANAFMEMDLEQYEFLGIVALMTATTDMAVLGISIKIMTTIWLPDKLRIQVQKTFGIVNTSSQDEVSSLTSNNRKQLSPLLQQTPVPENNTVRKSMKDTHGTGSSGTGSFMGQGQ
jgi:hypothetical protein